MDDETTIRFQFDCEGIQVDISGERAFVDEMYRRLMRDIETVRQKAADRRADDDEGAPAPELFVLQRCGELMRTIYLVTADDLVGIGPLSPIDLAQLETVYVEKSLFDQFSREDSSIETLWSQLTEAGMEKLGEAKT